MKYDSKEFSEELKNKYTEKSGELDSKIKSREESDFLLLGKIVHYHQILEDSIMRYIKFKVPEHTALEKRLKMFGAKYEFFKGFKDVEPLKTYFPAVQELVSVRNKYAHNLDCNEVSLDMIKSIVKVCDDIEGEGSISEEIEFDEYIKIFTIFFVSLIDANLSIKSTYQEFKDKIEFEISDILKK